MLAFDTFGDDTAQPPILIAHGLFGSGRNWRAIARALARRRQVITVDMRNHGHSFWAPHHGYEEMAGDLAEVVSDNGGLVDLLGHSMGGKAAMALALTESARVRKLMVADIAPVPYDHGDEHLRLISAMQGLNLETVASREEASRALAGQIEDVRVRSFLVQSFDPGEKRWRFNLDVLAREMDKIMGFPEVSSPYAWPAFFLSGAQSDYVKRWHRKVIKRLFPMASQAKLPGAGHWLHAERPREFIAAAEAFFNA